jgi:flagellar protein FlaJ
MAQNKPPLMMVPLDLAKKLAFPFLGVSFRLKRFFPELKQELNAAEIKMEDYEYLAISIVNILFYYFLFFGLLFVLSYQIQLKPLLDALKQTFLYCLGIGLLISFALVRYPSIMAGKRAEQINKNLIFALRDVLMQISSGISLYNSFVNVSKAGYGLVSEEFEKVAKAINTGTPVDEALKIMAVSTKSDYLKRITWQIISTIKAGSSLKGALRAVVKELTREQKSMIRDYAHELNLWSLIYMLFAVAVPTIGAVMLVILSSFAGMGINNNLFIGFIVLCFLVQYVLIGFIKARRPVVQF